MKLNIKSDLYFTIFILIVFSSLVFIFYYASKLQIMYQEYDLKKTEMLESNIIYFLDCRTSNYESGMWQCPFRERLHNLTGSYCNNTMLCQNEYKIKEVIE